MAKATKKDLKKIKEQLTGEREELLRQIEELERGGQNNGEPASFEGSDPADVGSDTLEREQGLTLARNLREVLVQVEDALDRIDEGSYGTCSSCEKPIEAARLKALPHASLCIECKRTQERRF